MPSALEDNAFEPVEEISYSEVPTHILSNQYSGTYIGLLKKSKFQRFTRVDFLTSDDYKTELGIYFEGVGDRRSRFLPYTLFEEVLETDVSESGPSGNSPHCLFCKDTPDLENTTKLIEWPFNEKYSIHSPCYEEFQNLIRSIKEEHKSELLAAVV